MPLRQSTVQSLSWAMVESGGLSVVMLVTAILLARILGPEEFGLAALALGIVHLLNLAVETLFHDAIVQRKDLDDEHVDTALWTSTGVGALLFAGSWIGSPLLADLFDEPALAPVLAWMSVSLLLSGAGGVLAASYRREMRFKPIALRTLCGRLSGAAVAIAMAFAGFGVWSLVAQHLTSTGMATLWVWISATRRPRLRLSVRRLSELLSFATATFLTHLMLFANVRLFMVLLGYLLGPAALGYFSIATKLLDTLWYVLMYAFSNVALVLFSRMQHDRAKLRWAYTEATQLTAAVAVPAFAGLAVSAEEIVRLGLGSQWLLAVPLIQILAAGSVIAALRHFVPVLYTAVGRPYLTLIGTSGGLLVSIGGLLVFGRHGLLVAVAMWAGRVLVNLPVSVLLLRRILGIGIREQFQGTWVPLAAAAAMAAILYSAKARIVADWPALPTLALIVPSGAVIYALLVAVGAPQLGARFRGLAAEFLRGRIARPAASGAVRDDQGPGS